MKHNDLQVILSVVTKKLGFSFAPVGHGFPIPDGVLIDWKAKKFYLVEIGGANHPLNEYVGADDVIEIDKPFFDSQAETWMESQIQDFMNKKSGCCPYREIST